MAARAPPKRAPARAPPKTTTAASDDFKLLLREEALGVKDISESRASILYDICMVKANQVMMMKRRGYEISPEETVWIECSLDNEALLAQIKKLRGMTIKDLVKNVLNKKYTITRTFIPDQTTYNFYPYLKEGEEELGLGEFFYSGGKWQRTRTKDQIMETKSYETEVEYVDKLDISTFATLPFDHVSRKIVVFMSSEKNFQTEMKKMIEYRKRSVEIFHTSELFVDYFQHWLVPEQRIISDSEKIELLSPYLMIEDEEGEFHRTLNCKITESRFTGIHHTDIVMRYIGALPGKIVYWENESYISSFSTKEFGYMLVGGYKYNTNIVTDSEHHVFAGEQRPTTNEEEEDEEDTIEEEDEEEDEGLGDEDGDLD